MNELITITALNKQFGAQTVLNGVDLTITSEKIIGLDRAIRGRQDHFD